MGVFFTVIIAVLVFGFLIFIHEFGHYLFARIFKVTINEFSIGMGPRIFSRVSKKTGIRYSLAAVPIGGFVAMAGEERDEDGELNGVLTDDPNSFDKKPAWQRLIITLAGALVNIFAGFLAMVIVISATARPSLTVDQFYGESEEKQLGITVTSDGWLHEGDKIVGVNGNLPLVCDGKERPLERPKLKNPKHLQYTNILLEPQQYNSNKALRCALAALRGNVNEF